MNDAREKEIKKKIKKFYKEYFEKSQKEVQSQIQSSNKNQQNAWEKISEKMKDVLKNLEYSSSMKMNSFFFAHINEASFGFSICKKFGLNLTHNYSYSLGGYIELAFVIKPTIEVGACLDVGTEINWNDKEYSFYFDLYAMAEISVSLEIGAYVPSLYSPIQISLSLGLKGVLGAGKAGIKLSLYIGENKYAYKLYFEFEAFTLIFYILIKFEIQLKIISFSFEFYIFNHKFLGIFLETHKTTIHKYKGSKIKDSNSCTGTAFYDLIKLSSSYKFLDKI